MVACFRKRMNDIQAPYICYIYYCENRAFNAVGRKNGMYFHV